MQNTVLFSFLRAAVGFTGLIITSTTCKRKQEPEHLTKKAALKSAALDKS
jgi:hypothetical protein